MLSHIMFVVGAFSVIIYIYSPPAFIYQMIVCVIEDIVCISLTS